jgi:hypothetical protein
MVGHLVNRAITDNALKRKAPITGGTYMRFKGDRMFKFHTDGRIGLEKLDLPAAMCGVYIERIAIIAEGNGNDVRHIVFGQPEPAHLASVDNPVNVRPILDFLVDSSHAMTLLFLFA